MIPKIIHYCWFGGSPLTDLAKKCIESWKKYCPDYEIIEWNERNYDINKNLYMKQAYDAKKWGFVPDYARLDIIYDYGGIYLDTDVELLKPIDELLFNNAFVGMEKKGIVALGLGFGAEKGNETIFKLREQYKNLFFVNKDGSLNLLPSPVIQTVFFTANGLKGLDEIQCIADVNIYPTEYFCPLNFDNGKYAITQNSFSIHHYAASWTTPRNKINVKIYRFLNRCFGKKTADKVKMIFGKKHE